jgi:hypothetical protein
MKKVGRKLLFLVLVAVFAYSPIASAQCVVPGCQLGGQPTCNQYLPNPEFVHGCGWNLTTTAGYVDLTSAQRSFYTSSPITIPANEAGDLELVYNVEIFNPSSGTEQMRIEFIEDGVATYVGRVEPEGPAGDRSLPIGDQWKGHTFRVRFRWTPNFAPGNTSFRLQQAYLFAVAQ